MVWGYKKKFEKKKFNEQKRNSKAFTELGMSYGVGL